MRKCTCKESEKHGTTQVHCCNQCGNPDEEFWTGGSDWIPVKDELPIETESVLWCHVPVEEPYTVASLCDVGFNHKNFTHWQPLPKPPQS